MPFPIRDFLLYGPSASAHISIGRPRNDTNGGSNRFSPALDPIVSNEHARPQTPDSNEITHSGMVTYTTEVTKDDPA